MAASLMQVPPSGPGNLCEPRLSFQFRIVSNDSTVTILVVHPHTGRLILRHPPVNREVARTSAVAAKAPPLARFVKVVERFGVARVIDQRRVAESCPPISP